MSDKAEQVYEALVSPCPYVRLVKRGPYYKVERLVTRKRRWLGFLFPEETQSWELVREPNGYGDVHGRIHGDYSDKAIRHYHKTVESETYRRRLREDEDNYKKGEWQVIAPDEVSFEEE